MSYHTISLRTWTEPKFKTCYRCGRVGTRSFFITTAGNLECYHVVACYERQRRAEEASR